MCGIAGILDPDFRFEDHVEKIESMLALIQHRGPDDWGKWTSPNQQVTLGHRRLSILDTSSSGRQPFESPSGRYCLTYNGEVYNFKEIHAELGNIPLSSSSDTAVIAAAFDRWGVMASVKKFNGMFAIGVWDRQENRLTLVRDRFGKKPLYYGLSNRVFAFASELKPLQLIDGLCDEVCPVAVEELLKFGYIASPRSIFKSVKKLRAGECLTLDLSKPGFSIEREKYWLPSQASLSDIPDRPEDFVDFVESTLLDSVRLRMVSDVPLGAFLSGGIDSSLVCALMTKVATGPVKTFSIGFNEAGFNEAVYAKKVAEHLGTEHHERYLTGKDSLALIEKMPSVYSEPFADSSQLPTYLVSQFAREYVTVALSGDGGDELFSGYTRYAEVLSGWNRKSSMVGVSATNILSLADKLAPGLTSRMITRLKGRRAGRWGMRKVFRRELQRRKANSFSEFYYLNNSAYAIEDSILAKEFRAEEPRQLADWAESENHLAKMSTHDIRYYLPEDILTKVDRASMAVSLESRNPILDYRLVAPCLAALEKYKESSHPKWAIKSVLARYVPTEYFERPKQGFGIPFRQWLSNEIRPWMESLITKDRIQRDGYFDHARIATAWDEFLAGDRMTWGVIFWRLLIFQAWHDAFWETPSKSSATLQTDQP